VVGVGNAYRRDDAVGLAVAASLRGRTPHGVAIVECEQEPTRLLEAWSDADAAVVVDATSSGAEPGTLHRYDASETPVPARAFRSSTHAFGVGETIELSRALGTLPGRVVVYGVEGSDFSAGDGLSDAVGAGVETAVRAVLDDLELLRGKEAPCTSVH
jgi:hydrogenase maturation protease